MPYIIRKRGDKWCVCKEGDDGGCEKTIGCHSSRSAAQDQQRALYASEKQWEIKVHSSDWQYRQNEVNYTVTPDTGTGQVCANCRFFRRDSAYPCAIVKDEPLPIVSGGWCNEWARVRERNDFEMIMDSGAGTDIGQDAVAAMSVYHTGFQVPTAKSTSDIQFIGWWTNNYIDKEREIIANDAIADYVAKANRGDVPMPELWHGHIAGTRHGIARRLYHVGHFCIATGTFDDPDNNELVQPMKTWYAKMEAERKPVTMSHQFFYDPAQKRDGIYYHIEPFEISSLVRDIEANPYTFFQPI